MFFFKNKIKISDFNRYPELAEWEGVPEQFPYSLLDELLPKLEVNSKILIKEKEQLVYRSYERTISWIRNIVKTDIEDLNSNFAQLDGKYYDISIRKSDEYGQLLVTFNLRTKGLEGSTCYSIGCRRVLDDEDGDPNFVCIE